jgi:hypothetical protein
MVSKRFMWLLVCAVFLCSCDVNLFGWKNVAGGYYLDDWRDFDPGYILFPPNNGPGEIRVEQLGWKKPFIIVRPVDTADQWIVIDTRTNQRTTISNAQRNADQNYRNITVYAAADAWKRLRRTKQW